MSDHKTRVTYVYLSKRIRKIIVLNHKVIRNFANIQRLDLFANPVVRQSLLNSIKQSEIHKRNRMTNSKHKHV